MRTFRWGILGPGHIAEKFAEALQFTEGAIPEAVASRDAQRAANFANKYGFHKHYGSYEQLALDPDVDVIYIATPHGYHCEHALLCLEQGKPILVEKSLALSAGQVEKMIAAATRHHVFLMEAMWTRLLPVTRTLEKLIGDGRIGELISVRADFCFQSEFRADSRLYNLRLGGGALLDVGVYPLSLILLLLGEPDQVKATAHLSSTGADDVCQALLQYKDGRSAQMICAISFHSPVTADIIGTEGVIHIPSRWYRSSSLTLQKGEETPITIDCPIEHNGFEYQIREVMNCLDKGLTESSLLPPSFSLRTARVMDLIRKECGINYPIE